MDTATPAAVLLACPDDESASRLQSALAPAGWHLHRARSSSEALDSAPPSVVVVAGLDDLSAFVETWRARPRAAPLLLLAEHAEPGIDALLPQDTSNEVLCRQIALLVRLHRAEHDHRVHLAQAQDILDLAPVAVSVEDSSGRYLLVNRSWESAFQRQRAVVLGKTPHELFPPEEAERLDRCTREAIENGTTPDYEETATQPDGTHTYLRSMFALHNGSEPWAVCGIATDITDRKRAEQALHDSEALYHSLVETLPVSIFRKDLQGRFTFVNTPFCVELKRTPSQILGKRDVDFYPPDLAEKYRRDDTRVVSEVCVFECVEEHALPDGEMRYAHVIKSPLHDSDGHVIGMQGIFWDVTDRRRAEEELARTAADIEVARRVQRQLFPSPLSRAVTVARAAGFDVAGRSYPDRAIGGDYYDFFTLGDDALGVAIGDVCGHGTGPAMLMAITRAYLHAGARGTQNPGSILCQVNDLLIPDIESDRYITLLLARLDLQRRTLCYSSAGHATGYVIDRNDKVKHTLDSTGVPLAIHPASEFEVRQELPLESGDLVVLLTDGVVEARDPLRQTFGHQRVLEIARIYRWADSAQIVDNLFHAVRAFSQYTPQLDDITAVVIKVEGSSQ